MDLEDVHREALHDWLNERPGLIERPDPSEYEDTPSDTQIEEQIEALGQAALTPWPPTHDVETRHDHR